MKPALAGVLVGYAVLTSTALVVLRHVMPDVIKEVRAEGGVTEHAKLIAVGLVLYGCSMLVWLYLISQLPIGVLYPTSVALVVLATTVISRVWLGEAITLRQAVGALVVIAGLTLLYPTSG